MAKPVKDVKVKVRYICDLSKETSEEELGDWVAWVLCKQGHVMSKSNRASKGAGASTLHHYIGGIESFGHVNLQVISVICPTTSHYIILYPDMFDFIMWCLNIIYIPTVSLCYECH